jgi:riboflavin transporter FmnP
MENTKTKKLIYTALCITLGLVLTQINRLIPIANIGAVIAPMHIPVLLSGFLCGLPYAVFCGMILPLLSFVLNGVPPIYPIGISMMFELATYGALTAILYRYTKKKIYPSLIGAMIGGRIVMGIVNAIIFGVAGKSYGMSIFITSAFITILPGIIIQLTVIPAILYALKKAKLIT